MPRRVVNAIDWFYQGWRRKIIRRTGIKRIAKPIYNRLKLISHPDSIQIKISGENVKFHTTLESEILRFQGGLEEQEIIEDMLRRMSSDDCFFDIGANIGLYTLFVATKTNKVYAFDPVQNNLSRLNENLALNNLQANLLPLALSDEIGVDTLELTQDYESSVGHAGHILSSVTKDQNNKAGRNMPVFTMCGDCLTNQDIIHPPNVIKIDVDGTEYQVIQGLTDTLRRDDCRLIYVEVHRGILEDIGVNWESIEEIVEDHGFDITRMDLPERDEQSGTYILRGVK